MFVFVSVFFLRLFLPFSLSVSCLHLEWRSEVEDAYLFCPMQFTHTGSKAEGTLNLISELEVKWRLLTLPMTICQT